MERICVRQDGQSPCMYHGDTHFDRSLEAKRVRVIVSNFEHCYSTPHVALQIDGVVDQRHLWSTLDERLALVALLQRRWGYLQEPQSRARSGEHGPILQHAGRTDRLVQ